MTTSEFDKILTHYRAMAGKPVGLPRNQSWLTLPAIDKEFWIDLERTYGAPTVEEFSIWIGG